MKENGKQLALWGIVLQFGTLIGLAGTVILILRSFENLAQENVSQTETIASDISIALFATAGGMALSLIGVILLLIALFGAKYRAPWFKTAMWILAVLWLFSMPIGTILGIIVIVYLSKHNDEFTELSPAPYGSPGVGLSPVKANVAPGNIVKNTPVWTYVIIFSNSILPPLILSLVIGGLIVSTNGAGEHFTFMELYYPAVLAGFYLSAVTSLLYYLVIRLGRFRPRWWSNLLLILLGYLSIPVMVLLFGFSDVTIDAMAKLGGNIFNVFLSFVVGFIGISILTRKGSNKATQAIGVDTPLSDR